MENENTNVGMEEVVETTEANVETTATDVENVESTENDNQQKEENIESKEKTFTQEQLNDIMRKRIERERNSIIKKFGEKYGANDENELDDIFKKSLSYDVMKERYEEIVNTKKGLERELAFLRNNIEPSKEDDIIAHFKGKEMEFNEETLKSELQTHPEWLKVAKKDTTPETTITALSPDRQDKPDRDEAEEMAKLFGLKGFIR